MHQGCPQDWRIRYHWRRVLEMRPYQLPIGWVLPTWRRAPASHLVLWKHHIAGICGHHFVIDVDIYPVVSCWLSIDDFKYGEVCRRRTFSFANLKQSRIKNSSANDMAGALNSADIIKRHAYFILKLNWPKIPYPLIRCNQKKLIFWVKLFATRTVIVNYFPANSVTDCSCRNGK